MDALITLIALRTEAPLGAAIIPAPSGEWPAFIDGNGYALPRHTYQLKKILVKMRNFLSRTNASGYGKPMTEN